MFASSTEEQVTGRRLSKHADYACLSRGWLRSSSRSKEQPEPAADRPREQPRQPVPVWPTFAPVWNCRCDPHHFPHDTKPEHMLTDSARREARADPCTKYRDNHEKRGARTKRCVGGNAIFDEIARKNAGKQWICCQHQNNTQQVGANYDSNRSKHCLTPPSREEKPSRRLYLM